MEESLRSMRKVIGYDRIEGQEIVDLLNDIYSNEFRLLNNFFYATQKLKSKKRVNGRIIKKYEKAGTQYQRVLNSKKINSETKKELRQEYDKLNPAELQRILHIKLQKLNKIFSVSKTNLATTSQV